MTAIFGLFHLDHQPVIETNLARMNSALAHHGQENSIWTHDGVGLGQRSMDFTPQDPFERQPLVSADKQFVLITDARLDNRDELFSHFQFSVPNLQIPDSALILRAYQTWGVDCLQHLNGVFVFAIWDAPAQKLFLARSPIAAPGLVYYSSPGTFAFATRPSGLHALPFVQRALDETHLANMMIMLRSDFPATLYRDITRLPSGHWLTIGRDGLKIENYWRPDLKREIYFARDEEYTAAFSDLFARVVSDHLRSATPVSIQMSGGLDSASVAATAARLLAPRGERLTAFTEVPRAGFAGHTFSDRYADETPLVQAIAAMYHNLDLNLMRTDGQSFLNNLDEMFVYLEEPFRNTSNRVWIEAILREAGQRGSRVLLDGALGNLTISWNGSGVLSGLIRAGQWGPAFEQARANARGRSPFSILRELGKGVLPLLPNPLWLAVNWLRHPAWPTSQPWVAYVAVHPDFARAQHLAERSREKSYATQFRPKADTRQIRYETLLNLDGGAYLSAYRAMFGLDMRTPPADVRLAEFCLRLPEDQYLRNGEARRLIRRAMTGQLPAAVLANHRRGLQAADWYERLIGARVQVAETLTQLEHSDLARRILDLKRLRRMFEEMPPLDQVKNFTEIGPYRLVFEPGLMLGRFLCWFEAGG